MEKKKLNLKEIGIEKLIILFCTGVILLILSLPGFQKSSNDTDKTDTAETSQATGEGQSLTSSGDKYTEWMEKRLEGTLGKMEGIGTVKVMITLKESGEKMALKDAPYSQESTSENDGGDGSRISTSETKEDETVMVSSGSGESTPYIVKETVPAVQGVLVLAEGASNGKTISEIVEAVQVLFDVPAHKIKVMKMESRSK